MKSLFVVGRDSYARWILNGAWALLFALLVGCATTGELVRKPSSDPGAVPTPPAPEGLDYLRVGERVVVIYSDIPNPPPATDQQIREDGKITLHLAYEVVAAGKRRGDLEKEIRRLYVEEKRIYKDINITIQAQARYFSVGGEVRASGSYIHPGEMTVLRAINTAGGLGDFADRRRIVLTHAKDKSQTIVNYKQAVKDARYDPPVLPGDSIFVDKSLL